MAGRAMHATTPRAAATRNEGRRVAHVRASAVRHQQSVSPVRAWKRQNAIAAAAAAPSSSSSPPYVRRVSRARVSARCTAGGEGPSDDEFDVAFEPLEDEDMKHLKEGNVSLKMFEHLVTDEFLEEIRSEAGYFDKPLPHPYDSLEEELKQMRESSNNKEDGVVYDERLLQARRVAKTVKGGRQVSFRSVVVIGDNNGAVGVGVGKAKEVVESVDKARKQAFRNMIVFPIDKNGSFPHRVLGASNAARVMLRPAGQGTGLIAGGAARVVLEAAGIRNGFAKQLRSKNHLNNARATIDGLLQMRTHEEVAEIRGKTVWEMWGK